jgi:hypothetical protein
MQTLRSPCEFTATCPLYRVDSYTCRHGGGSYCGKYRELMKVKGDKKENERVD